MGVGGRRDFFKSSKCEYCHQTNNVELRKSDMVCQSYDDVEEQEFSVRKEDKTGHDLLNKDIDYIDSTEIEGVEAKTASDNQQ